MSSCDILRPVKKLGSAVLGLSLLLFGVGCSTSTYEVVERSAKEVANYGAPGTHEEISYVLLSGGRKIYATCDVTSVDNLDSQATCGFRPLRKYQCQLGRDNDLWNAPLPISDLKCLDADGRHVYLYVYKEETAYPNQFPLASALIALQFVAFGWRINREISVGDEGRKAWLPLPDIINLVSLIAVTLFCAILPCVGLPAEPCWRLALSVGYTLIALHPLNEAAHYSLLIPRESGREVVDDDYVWISRQEIFTVTLSVAAAVWVAVDILRG